MYLHLLTVLVQLSFIFDSTILVKKELRTVKKKDNCTLPVCKFKSHFFPNHNIYIVENLKGALQQSDTIAHFFRKLTIDYLKGFFRISNGQIGCLWRPLRAGL